MPKKKLDPYAERPYSLEYYEQLIHRNPRKITATASEVNARVAADKHFEHGDYIKAVCVKRESGRVLWTKMKIGPHLIEQRGHQHHDELVVNVPGKEAS